MASMTRAVLCSALAFGVVAVAAGPAAAAGRKAVYTSTNAAENAVLVFDRARDGSLSPAGSFATGGSGTGGGLGNQGALELSGRGRFLYVVNAGSDSVSTFAVRSKGDPVLVGTTPSGGDQPIGLTVHHDLVYVLNAGSGTISGFAGARHGELAPLSGSTRPIAGAGPAEVKFSNDADLLVVTDKGTNTIDTFVVGSDGRAGPAQSHASEGATPFGFDFDKRGHVIVSEAFGGAPGASAVSSYSVDASGGLDTISASVHDDQAAACWIAVTKNGRFAYTTNTGSGSISSYSVGHDGSLALLESIAADTGAGSSPTDLALTKRSRVLFALLPGSGAIAAYQVERDGDLDPIGAEGGIPSSATGLAAR